MNDLLWQPSIDRIHASHLTRFQQYLAEHRSLTFPDYQALHRWSVTHAPEFWRDVWDYCGVIGNPGLRLVDRAGEMPGARFLPDARLNVAENLLRGDGDRLAIMAVDELGGELRLSLGALRHDVARAAAALRAAGVRPGDRVCGVMPNVAETVIAALGAAAIGAVWSSCSPDFGADGIVDRFGQIAPVVLFSTDGYSYGGQWFDVQERIADVVARIPSIREVVLVARRGGDRFIGTVPGAVAWGDWLARGTGAPLIYEWFAFDHPLFILYSSGTTGVPKCIVHGAGGTLIEHLKEHQLQCDVQVGDRVLYFTTCGWMMWNWLITALASGAAIVLYDGAPLHPGPSHLFDIADRHSVTLFGTSPRFLDAISRAGFAPRETHRLSSIRTIASTGAPLSPELFDLVYRSIKPDVQLASISGGTDIVGCFVGGNPNGAVWRGEIQAAGLGMDVRVLDADGRELEGRPGELACATPFPSMPVGFWNDADGSAYRRAYFERLPGVWWHGDWIQSTPHHGYVIYGRSDATLNPGGVRIGTAEIYRQMEQLPEVLDSVAVAQRWEGDERIVLFVRLADGIRLDEALRKTIATRLRTHASPRHVPARIVQVPDVPRTRSGKIVEIAVRKIVRGEPVDNIEALANPESLQAFHNRPELET